MRHAKVATESVMHDEEEPPVTFFIPVFQPSMFFALGNIIPVNHSN